MAKRSDIVAAWKIFNDLHVRGQTGAGEDPLKQIVAEQRGLRHTPGQGGLEGVDVIDALAGVGPLAKQVLVDV